MDLWEEMANFAFYSSLLNSQIHVATQIMPDLI